MDIVGNARMFGIVILIYYIDWYFDFILDITFLLFFRHYISTLCPLLNLSVWIPSEPISKWKCCAPEDLESHQSVDSFSSSITPAKKLFYKDKITAQTLLHLQNLLLLLTTNTSIIGLKWAHCILHRDLSFRRRRCNWQQCGSKAQETLFSQENEDNVHPRAFQIYQTGSLKILESKHSRFPKEIQIQIQIPREVSAPEDPFFSA